MEIKPNNRALIKEAETYFCQIVREFIYCDDPVFVTNKQRKIRLSKNTKNHIDKQNLDRKDWLQNVFDDQLDIVVQHWIQTRAAYRPDAEFPSDQLKNYLAWEKLGIMYLYVIDMEEAYLDVIPLQKMNAMRYWCKLATRFIDARKYPKVTHYFTDDTQEQINIVDPYKIMEYLYYVIGDKDEGNGFPRHKRYSNQIVTTKGEIQT